MADKAFRIGAICTKTLKKSDLWADSVLPPPYIIILVLLNGVKFKMEKMLIQKLLLTAQIFI